MAETTKTQRYADADSNTDGAYAFDTIASVEYAVSKMAFGDADTITRVTSSAGLPVAQQGTWTVDLGATDNAVLDAIAAAVAGTLTVDGSGVTQPVSGTVTANLSATDNAVLDTIELNTDSLAVVGGGTEATALRVTLASDSTGVVSIDDNGGSITVDGTVAVSGTVTVDLGANNDVTLATLPDTASGDLAAMVVDLAAIEVVLGTIDTDTGAMVTDLAAIEVLLTTIEGNQLANGHNVVVSSALPAGTNNIGDVDVLSVIPGTGATSLGKAIDSAAGSTDTGVATLAVRDDSLSALTPIEGDYVPLRVNSTGALHVTGGGGGTQYAVDDVAGGTDTGTLLLAIRDDSLSALTPADGDYTGLRVSSTGALHVTGGGGGTEYSEDVAAPATIVGTATMMERDDALASLTPVEGDWASMRCNANGALWTAVDGTVTVDLGANNDVTVTGSVTANAGTNLNTSALALETGGNLATIATNTGSLLTDLSDISTYTAAVADGMGTAGTPASAVLTVQGVGSMTPLLATLSGTNTVDAVTTCSTVTTLTGGGVAHDSADSGNPHKIGAKASTSVAGVTLVANADRTDLYAGADGVLITRPHCSLEDIVSEVDTNTDGAATAFGSGLAAPGAGVRLYITSVTIANSSSAFCTVDMRDGSAGSVLWTFPVPAEGGVTHTFNPPLKLTANTALAYDASAATTTLSISAIGFKSKV